MPDELPYKVTVTCSKCGREVLVESAIDGPPLDLYLYRIRRLGCPECQLKDQSSAK